jgi:AraC-like DNA-binding protein
MPIIQSNQQTQPQIVKFVDSSSSNIGSVTLSRYAIGYILHGTKNFFYGDKCCSVSKGEIFYMGIGHHHVENIGEEDTPFEEIVFYYTPTSLQHIISHLNITYGVRFSNNHSCEWCRTRNYVAMPAWNTIKSFFINTNSYLREELFRHDETAENIKLTELLYLLISHGDSCIKSKLLRNMDVASGNFEQIVYNHMFKDISIEQLSEICNRSLTSFKKEFKRHFDMPPHKWYIRQRLIHSRLLLISTTKSVSEIGHECAFPNTSHFIKLFKKEYSITPSAYRNRHLSVGKKGKFINDTTLHHSSTDEHQHKTQAMVVNN